MRKLIFLAAMFFASNAIAATYTIDLEEPNLEVVESVFEGVSGSYITAVRSKGFELEYQPFGDGSILQSGGEDNQLAWGPNGSLAFSALDQRVFDLSSVDLSTWENDVMTITGYYAGGGTVQTSANIIGNFAVTNFTFDQSWQALEKVIFTTASGPGIIDNVVVQAVPIPAAVWLFGSALAGLGFMRRRQTA